MIRKNKRYTPAIHDDLIRSLHAKGLCDKLIGEEIDFGESTIQKRRIALGLKAQRKVYMPKEYVPEDTRKVAEWPTHLNYE